MSGVDVRLDAAAKGLAVPAGSAVTVEEYVRDGRDVHTGGLDFPVLTLDGEALDGNIAAMADYCARNGVLLAPHGKTTMAPRLFDRQLAAGAWAITVATPAQLRACHAFGVPRILLANLLVDPAAIAWVGALLDADPGVEVLCYVDSAASVRALDRVLTARGQRRPLPVLLEVGYRGGRTGCRDLAEARRVAEAAAGTTTLRLAGVSAFEGLIPAAELATVRGFLADVRRTLFTLAGDGAFPGPVVASAGGSLYFDLVVEELGPARLAELPGGTPAVCVLRSGCYVTHAAGGYQRTSPLAGRSPGGSVLREALELWATVWSRPEPELVVLGFGRRDVGDDMGAPVPRWALPPDGRDRRDVRDRFEVTGLNDQHAFVRVPADDPIAVGDRVVSGVHHPCTTVDKWRHIPVLDPGGRVTDVVSTFF
ncbi:alanine racemase [Marinitenerispora sediminis]|uniref:Amino acid deaminase n=1 Tax=Marinitenerispora sediminis TaxID=1931232 RepID=A0A368T3E5_9ACTN|nr:alanine racemase [Marinitenerispora sediminis]RCV48447.1 amino acid deaminase [Marinitenerispora sediminis]RCV52517.1 amino acid deaminase [Marinitenerispora sediminis]RCV56383.1 amino acid deaminase [Marinitenerispora sediminis]